MKITNNHRRTPRGEKGGGEQWHAPEAPPLAALEIMQWATAVAGTPGHQQLAIDMGPRPTAMADSCATGQGLVSNGHLGADIIRLAAGEGFVPHTHPGDHLLLIIGGQGTITYGGKIYPTNAGQIFLIEGTVPHAVGAITDHLILAIGSPHKPVDAPDRMTLVAYEAVTAELKTLHCLLCDRVAHLPDMLHDLGCPHCPCTHCNP